MSNNKSRNIVIAGLITIVSGLLGYVIFGRKTSKVNVKENVEDTEDKDKIESVNDVIAAYEYNNSEELIYSILLGFLEKKTRFEGLEGMLNELARQFTLSCLDLDWFNDFPSDVKELEQFLRSHGLYGVYVDTLAENKKVEKN